MDFALNPFRVGVVRGKNHKVHKECTRYIKKVGKIPCSREGPSACLSSFFAKQKRASSEGPTRTKRGARPNKNKISHTLRLRSGWHCQAQSFCTKTTKKIQSKLGKFHAREGCAGFSSFLWRMNKKSRAIASPEQPDGEAARPKKRKAPGTQLPRAFLH